MPVPTSVSEFLDLTQRSGVLEEARLTCYVQQLRSACALPTEPNHLARLMIRDGLLTYFQAEQLLMGKWKRFAIGRYKVLERLGSGGMGQVYLCEHKLMRRRVAIKVLPTAKAEDASSRERFYREARAVAALDHPNIVRAYDIDQEDNLHFLIMEFVDGSNLQEIVKKTGPMSPLRACHYIYQSALGLQHAFDRAGLIHRDVKPANILVDRSGVVKILDMGLARFFHDDEDLLTKKYDESVLGTADYLAPEQALDSHNVDIRADIYSLGATFYFTLTGHPPFPDGTVTQKLIWHQNREPKAVAEYRNDVPADVLAILDRMMQKDPNLRFQVPSELAEVLAPLVQTPIPPPTDEEMPKLSPAAMGMPGGASATTPLSSRAAAMPSPPPTPTSPALRRGNGAPTTPPAIPTPRPLTPAPRQASNAAAPVPAVASVAAVAPSEPDQLWAQLAAETPNPTSADTAHNRPAYKPPSTTIQLTRAQQRRFAALTQGKKKWIIGGAAVVTVLLIAAGAAIVVGAFKPPSPRANPVIGVPSAGETDNVWVVDAAATPQGNTVNRLYLALAKARPGARILVRSDLREAFNIDWSRHRAVSIEADAPGIVWHLPAEIKNAKAILDLTRADDVRIRGFSFDGEGKADHGIYMAFRCPGVTIEDVRFVNFNKSAVMLSNAAGEDDRRIDIRRIHVQGSPKTQAGIALFARPNFDPPLAADIRITDCIFEGAISAVSIDGPIRDVRFERNRVFKTMHGIIVKPVQPAAAVRLSIQQNTFFGLDGAALLVETLPAEGTTFAIEQNYFANCKNVATLKDAKPLPGLQARGNARNGVTADVQGISPTVIDHAFASLDVADSGRFLRYARDAALATAPGGPIGAPPKE